MAGYGPNDTPAEEAPGLGAYSPKDKPASGALRRVADAGIDLARGVIGVPEAAVGIADLATGGRAGKLAEDAGIRFKEAKDFLAEGYSPEREAANAEVAQAEGFVPTLGALARNPSTIVGGVLESAPSMLGAGGVARGVMRIAPRVGSIAAGAIGEGAAAAGQNTEQVRQETPGGVLPDGAALPLAASGAVTGAIGLGAGRLANRLGIGEASTMLAAGKLGPVGEEAIAAGAKKGVLRKIAEGAAVEGGLQELPQSYQEQVAQNIAQGKQWDEGAAAAGAQGLLVGGVMGGVAGPLHSGEHAPAPSPVAAPAGPITQALLPAPVVRVDSEGNARRDGQAVPVTDEAPATTIGRAAVDVPATEQLRALPPPTVTVDSQGNARAPGQFPPVPEPGPRETGAIGMGRNSELVEPAGPITAALGFDNSPTGVLIGGADGVRQELRPEILARRNATRVQDGDILGEQGKPFQGAIPAARAARQAGGGHSVVKVDGGYVVRQLGDTQGVTDVTPRDVAPFTVAGATPEGETKNAAAPAAQPAPSPIPQTRSPAPATAAQGPRAAGAPGAGVDTNTPLKGAPNEPGQGEVAPAPGGRAAGSQSPADRNQPAPLRAEAPGARRGATRDRRGTTPVASPVDAAAHAAATSPTNALPEPTDAQKAAGNYSKGHTRIAGLDIAIENPQGSTRSGTDENGKPWSTTMQHHYGYVKGTTGNDGDQVDVFVKPGTPENFAGSVYVVDQVNPKTGAFDEHKAVIGARNQQEAQRIYRSNYAADWTGMGPITSMPVDAFKSWVRDGEKRRPLAKLAQPLSVGMAPGSVEPVTVRDGVVHIGENPAINFDSGEDVKVPAGASDTQVKQALREAGALSKRQKFFGGQMEQPQQQQQASAGGRNARGAAWDRNPLRHFLATHGITPALANEFVPGLKERRAAMVPGIGPIFKRGGKQLDELARAAAEEGFLPPGSDDVAAMHELIQRAINGERIAPLYAEGAAEQEAQRRLDERAAKHIEEHEELSDLVPEDLDTEGYDRADPELQDRVRALMAQAEQNGVDAEAVLEDVAKKNQNASTDDYHRQARDALEAALAREGSAGEEDRGRPAPAQGAEPAQGEADAASEGLTDDGIAVTPGKGLIKGKFLSSADGNGTPGGPWNTEAEARAAAEAWRARMEQSAATATLERERKDKFVQKLREGHEPTVAEIEALGLRARGSDLTYFIPTAADLFGISSRAVRPLIKDLIRVGYTDMGAKRESVNPMKALAQMARPAAEGVARDLLGDAPNPSQQEAAKLTGERAEKERQQQANAPEAEDFTLTGSDRPADEAAARGQRDLLAEPQAPEPAVHFSEDDIPLDVAVRAFGGTSHMPERRGASVRREYVAMMNDAWDRGIKAAGDDPEAIARVTAAMQKLRDGYLERTLAYLHSHANVASAMIAGPAKFPTERNRKRGEAADKKALEASDFLKKGIARMLKTAEAPVDNSPEGELSRVRAKLEQRERDQATMKAANAALRKGDDAALKALGLSDERIAKLKKPDFAGRPGFPDYALANNNAEIRRLRERLQSAEQRTEQAAEGPTERIVHGVRVEEDAQADRLRLRFEGKPSEAVRTDLKAAGFRWSPREEAWQRQLTDAARERAEEILAKHFGPHSQGEDGSPQFKRGEPRAPSMSYSDVEQAVRELTRDWIRRPEIKILEGLNDPDVPDAVHAELQYQREQGSAGGTVHGFHLRGTVYLMADAVRSPQDVARVLFHESLGHFGLRGFFGKSLNTVLEEVVAQRKFLVAAKAKAYGLDMAKGADRLMAAEEVLAELAQTRPELPIVQRAIAAIRTWLREHVAAFKDLALSDAEIIRNYILPARGFVERGLNGKPTFARVQERPQASKDRTVQVDGIRRPIENASDQTLVPNHDVAKLRNFWKWFGASKVADEQGRPLVVFHGSQQDVSQFDRLWTVKNLGRRVGIDSVGSWFSTNPSQDGGAGMYGDTLYPVYLAIKNPSTMTFAELNDAAVDKLPKGEKRKPGPAEVEQVRDELKAAGYDGIKIVHDPKSESTEFAQQDSWIAFEPEQIKSAIGNNGDFNPNDARVAFSKKAIVGETSRQYTPDQLKAMDNVGFRTDEPSLKERAQDLWKNAGKKLAQGIVDQFAPVKDLDKQAYGLLRLAKGASGAFEVFLRGGKLKLTDGVYDFDDTQKGGVVDKLLMPLGGEHHDFFRWIAANRAERLAREDKEHLFTAADIAALKTLDTGTTGFDYTLQNAVHGVAAGTVTRDRTLIYRDAQTIFNEFNKNALDMAEQSGLIDGETRHLWEHEFYVPFYRVADDEDGGIRGANIKSSVVRQEAFKALKGGKNALNADLLDNTLMNWAHLLDAAAKNRAAKATLEAAEKMGIAIEAPQATAAAIASSTASKRGLVWFMEGGLKRHFVIDQQSDDGPFVLTALTSLEYAGMRNPVMNAMGAFKHALTMGVTASPFFKVRNLIRDSVQAIGTGPMSFNVGKNLAQGWKLTRHDSANYFRLMAGGGTIHFGTMLEGSEAKRVQALVESGVDDSTILNSDQKVKAFYRKFIEPGITAYNELGNRGEAINRASLYDQLVKQGVSHAEASLQARDLMDFSMQGSFTTVRFLTQVVPFFNARVQGLYKLGRAAKEDPRRLAAVLGATALFSVGLLAAYQDDDDWKKREDWDRNNYWWFKFGGTALRIPKPFEVGAIATLAERGFELAFSKEMTNKRFLQNVLSLAGDNLSLNPVPQLVKPMIDVYANYDSFTNRPIESLGMERLKPEYRFNDRTSMVARGASTALNAVTGLANQDALSPLQIEHLLRGYFGWLGAFIVGASDAALRPATNQPAHATPDYWKALTGGMASELEGAPSRYVSQMYQQAKEIDQAYGTWKQLQKEGKTAEAAEFRADHLPALSEYHTAERLKKLATSVNQRIKAVEASDLSGEEKRDQIRALQRQKDRIARALPAI